MEGPLSVFGDRSTGEAIRSQNGKGARILRQARGPGRGPTAVARPGLPPRHSEVPVEARAQCGPHPRAQPAPWRPSALGRTLEHGTRKPVLGGAQGGCGRPRPEWGLRYPGRLAPDLIARHASTVPLSWF